MEDKPTIEILREQVTEILETYKKEMKLPAEGLVEIKLLLDNAELVAETFTLQIGFPKVRQEQPGDDLPSEEELQELSDLIDAARTEIERIEEAEGNEVIE
jgi:hypothetical protein